MSGMTSEEILRADFLGAIPEVAVTEDGWVGRALKATLLFNLIDVILTLCLVTCGLAVEANPIMAQALMSGSVAFVVVKFTLVFSGVATIWLHRHRRFAMLGAATVTVVYGMLMIYHVQSLVLLVDYLNL